MHVIHPFYVTASFWVWNVNNAQVILFCIEIKLLFIKVGANKDQTLNHLDIEILILCHKLSFSKI